MPRILDHIVTDSIRDVLAGKVIFPPFFLPCRQKILIVADGSISFGDIGFGLSRVLHLLENNPEWWARFDITCAKREGTAGTTTTVNTEQPGVTRSVAMGFKFTPGSLDTYHQVWLFGINSGNPSAVSNAELEVLSRWMDLGGGVLAMGDHDELGADLCAKVPRVRSMRRWTNAQNVPPAGGLARHDTDVKGDDAFYQGTDQSDSHPMHITPRYRSLAGWSPFLHRRAPHPLLCGTDGVITILPDHPHEGWVYDDAEIDLTQNFSFGAYVNKPEYPAPSGNQPTPEWVAKAHVQPDHTNTSDLFKGAADAKTFVAIGAYDGHRANVGRVVVDSTWHHWFNVNLEGFGTVNPTPPATLTTTMARVANYFRNVALWLAPPAKQVCMFKRATWGSLFIYPLVEELHVKLPIWELGQYARDAIGRRASQCTLIYWIDVFYPREIVDIFKWRKPIPDPCLSCPPFELLEIYTWGGIVRELLPLRDQALSTGKVSEQAVAKAVATGIKAGMNNLLETQEKSLRETQASMKKLSGALRALPNEEFFMIKEDAAAPRKGKTAIKQKPRR